MMAGAAPQPMQRPTWFEGYRTRFWQLMDVCGPPSWTTLFASQTQIARARDVLQRDKDGAGVPPADVKWSNKLLNATLHPDSGDPIPAPFRMNAHVAMNTVLLVGMQLSTGSVVGGAFWQFANQSFNACQFYANRNATNNVSNRDLAASYCVAVFGSMGLSVALTKAAARMGTSPRGRLVRMLMPFTAVAAAKPMQIGLMRSDELARGVQVRDSHGTTHGSSVMAGRIAVGQTVTTRILYLIPPMVLPPLVYRRLENTKAVGRRPWLLFTVNVACVAFMSAITTPACIALFEPLARVNVARLEPKFRHLQHEGQPIEYLYFNKGL